MDKLLNNPTSLKIIAVLIALLIWVVVHIDPETSPQSVTSNTDTKVIEAAPVIAEGLEGDKFIVTAMEPTVVRLVVEGRITSLYAANNDDYVVKLNLKGVEPGIHELPLTTELPSGIKVVEVSPRIVTVQIEELETQTREVQVITEGQPAEGYIIGDSTIVGNTGNVVEVTMPKDDYAYLGMLAVTVDVTDANSTVTNKKAKIIAYDTQGNPMNHVKISPDTLTAETKITLPEKEVPVQLRYTGTLPEGFSLISITSEVEKVTINARKEKLEQVTMFDGYIVDLSKIKASGEVTVKAELPDGIAAVTPVEIPVKVVVEPAERRTMSNVPITIVGLPEDMKININDSSNGRIDVVVKGASSLLSRLRQSDIKLSLDVTGLSEGTHQLTVAAELPAFLQIEESDEFSLTVNVKLSNVEQDVEVIAPPEQNSGETPISSNHPAAGGVSPTPSSGAGGNNSQEGGDGTHETSPPEESHTPPPPDNDAGNSEESSNEE